MKFASPIKRPLLAVAILLLLSAASFSALTSSPAFAQTRVSLQPFAQQIRQVETSLSYLGQPLAQKDRDAINLAIANADEAAAVAQLQETLDKYTLAIVDINAES